MRLLQNLPLVIRPGIARGLSGLPLVTVAYEFAAEVPQGSYWTIDGAVITILVSVGISGAGNLGQQTRYAYRLSLNGVPIDEQLFNDSGNNSFTNIETLNSQQIVGTLEMAQQYSPPLELSPGDDLTLEFMATISSTNPADNIVIFIAGDIPGFPSQMSIRGHQQTKNYQGRR